MNQYVINHSSFRLLLYLLFPFSVFVDLLNGFLQAKMQIDIPIAIAYRMTIMIIMLNGIKKAKHKEHVKKIHSFCIWFILASCIWIITTNDYNAGVELRTWGRYLYFFVCIAFFICYKQEIEQYKPIKWISIYGLMLSFAIIFSFFTGYENVSYGEDYGFGTKSYFYAGNELGLTMIYTSIIISLSWLSNMSNKYMIAWIISVFAGLLVGTRVATAGIISWFVIVAVYVVLIRRRHNNENKTIFFLIRYVLGPSLILLISYIILYVYSMYDDFMLARLTSEGLEDARGKLKEAGNVYISTFSTIQYLFGNGFDPMNKFIGSEIGHHRGYHSVETDLYDVFCGYGLIGTIIIWKTYIIATMKSAKEWFSHCSIINFSWMYICFTFIIVAYVGGHCFSNTMVAPIYAYVFSKLKNNSKN